MITPKVVLRIKAEKLGTITEVKNLLADLEYAYNSIYTFDNLVGTFHLENFKRIEEIQDRYHDFLIDMEDIKEGNKNIKDRIIYELFWNLSYFQSVKNSLPNILDLQSKIIFEDAIPQGEKLFVNKVNIQSPGMWEFLGSLNPLEQFRKYLNDRHERIKDKNYRNRQEEELGDLNIIGKENEVIGQRIKMLKDLGYSEIEIRQIITEMVQKPLQRLNKYQDSEQIENAEFVTLDTEREENDPR